MKMKKVFSKVVTFLMVFTFVFGAVGVIVPEKVKAADMPADGVYCLRQVLGADGTASTAGGNGGKPAIACEYAMIRVLYSKVTIQDGKISADILLDNTEADKYPLYVGKITDSEDLESDQHKAFTAVHSKEAKYDTYEDALKTLKDATQDADPSFITPDEDNSFVSPGELNKIVTEHERKYSFRNVEFDESGKWNCVTIYKDSSNKFNVREAAFTIDFSRLEDYGYLPADGEYTIKATSDNKMFKIVDTELKVKDGKMTADIALNADGYDYLIVGTAAAANADDSSKCGFEYKLVNVGGSLATKRVYINVPVSKLDKPIEIASYSRDEAKWYDRKITFDHTTLAVKKEEVKTAEKTFVIGSKDFVADKSTVIEVKNGTVAFDGTALAELKNATNGQAITLVMDEVTENTTFKDKGYDKVISIKLTAADGTPLFTTAANGKATITIPYDKAVEEGKTVKVYYVTDGKEEEVEATYNKDAKTVTFTLAHFSEYAIKQVAATAATTDTTTAEAPKTGDNSMVALMAIMMLMAGATVVTMKRKRA